MVGVRQLQPGALKVGDFLLIERDEPGAASRYIQRVTGSPFSHTAICVDTDVILDCTIRDGKDVDEFSAVCDLHSTLEHKGVAYLQIRRAPLTKPTEAAAHAWTIEQAEAQYSVGPSVAVALLIMLKTGTQIDPPKGVELLERYFDDRKKLEKLSTELQASLLIRTVSHSLKSPADYSCATYVAACLEAGGVNTAAYLECLPADWLNDKYAKCAPKAFRPPAWRTSLHWLRDLDVRDFRHMSKFADLLDAEAEAMSTARSDPLELSRFVTPADLEKVGRLEWTWTQKDGFVAAVNNGALPAVARQRLTEGRRAPGEA